MKVKVIMSASFGFFSRLSKTRLVEPSAPPVIERVTSVQVFSDIRKAAAQNEFVLCGTKLSHEQQV